MKTFSKLNGESLKRSFPRTRGNSFHHRSIVSRMYTYASATVSSFAELNATVTVSNSIMSQKRPSSNVSVSMRKLAVRVGATARKSSHDVQTTEMTTTVSIGGPRAPNV